MDSKSKAGDALQIFCKEYGAPEKSRLDGSKEQTGKNTEFQQQIRKHNIQQHVSEPNMHNKFIQRSLYFSIKGIRTRLRLGFGKFCSYWCCPDGRCHQPRISSNESSSNSLS
jgi:hypothetical protein